MVTSAFFFASMSAAVKAASGSLPSPVIVFARNAFGLVLLLPWAVAQGRRLWATEQPGNHLLRGAFGLGAMFCFFYSIGHLRLADAVLLTYTLPLFLPLVERVWLKEPIPRSLWLPLGVGFAGVVVILRPTWELFQPAGLVGLASGLLAAVAQVGIRRLTATESVGKVVFYYAVFATVASAFPLPATWKAPEGVEVLAALLAAAVFATVGQVFLTRAYSTAPAAKVGPFLYASVVFSALLDAVIWGVLPDGYFLVGAALVVGSGTLILSQGLADQRRQRRALENQS
jgi:drug/metabolite transporter (DMT)-like permease